MAPATSTSVNCLKKKMNKLLDIDELSALLGRSVHTIKKDLKQNPLAVPPRVHLPGTRLLRWRPQDIDVWLAEHVIGGTNA